MKNKFLFLNIMTCYCIILNACSGNQTPPPKTTPPTAVSIYEVKNENAVYFDNYPATTIPLNQVELKAQVTGYITGVYFKDGQLVTKGQKLYDIDRVLYQANYNQAIANLNVMKAAQAKVQGDVDRYSNLLKQDAIARQRVDYAFADLQSAKMQVAAARANADRIANDLRFSVIYAPFEGTIGISLAKVGSLVTANQNILNTVSSLNPMAVDISVDQKEINRFELMQRNPGKQTDSIFTLSLPDNTIYPSTGIISLIDRAVDPQTGTIKIRLLFNNKERLLKPGMSCNICVQNNNTGNLLLAPYKAVVEQMGEFFVFVVGDSSKVSQRRVILGTHIKDKVIIKEGLKEGYKIVVEGVQKLKEGSVVVTSLAKPN